MRLESQRTLILPGAPDEVWELLCDPSRLAVLAPEIEDAYALRSGLIRVFARLGRRRRSWRARPKLDRAQRRLELESATPGVLFRLTANVDPVPEGSEVRTRLQLEPPDTWEPNPQARAVPRRVVQRLLVSILLFSVSAAGVVALPSLKLTRAMAAIAYAIVGVAFVVGAALLSSARSPRSAYGRRSLFSRLPRARRARAPRIP